LYVRMDSSELGMTYDYELSLWYYLYILIFVIWVLHYDGFLFELEHVNEGHKKKGVIVAVIVSLAMAILCGILLLGWCYGHKSSTYVKGIVSNLKNKIESLKLLWKCSKN
jgi:hypothetical protein